MPAISGDILNRLPHGPEFRFLTRALEIEPGVRGAALWIVQGNESFFRGHFPGRPVVPGVLLIEAMAQLSGLICFDESAADARLAHSDVRFDSAIVPPAEIVLQSTLARRFGSLYQFDVQAGVSATRVARGSVTLASGPPAKPGSVGRHG